jgi:predicted nucleotide-binding protein
MWQPTTVERIREKRKRKSEAMPKINQALLERLAKKLEVTKAQVYARIQHVHNQTFLDRHIAALKLAADEGINIHKYSTPDERSQLRGARDSANPVGAPPTMMTGDEPRTTAKRAAKGGKSARPPRSKDNSVFVVHGRNEPLRKAMFDFLRALGLNPKEWNQALLMARGANPWTLDVIDAAMEKVQAVVVLFSPDDEAKLKDEFCGKNEKRTEGKLKGQPRANVIFEAGLAVGRHQHKTLLIQVGEVRGFTDILGKHIPKLSNDHAKRNDIANRLAKIGCRVDTTGDDWRTTGNFSA